MKTTQNKGGTILFLLLLRSLIIEALPNVCNRAPDGTGAGKSPSDGRFRIRISGNPELYTPGETYNISVAGIRSMQGPHKFSGFMLAVERENSDNGDLNSFLGSTGEFQLIDNALTRISDKCPNVVTQTSTLPKSEIQVLWTAPPAKSGCMVFRATIIEHRDVWYMDDGPLSKVLCEDEQDTVDNQPTVLQTCCACDEAKYEVTFEGLWSRHTHPKDFPTNSWLTRFSDIIGASHTINYRFWVYGELASEGLKQVAEHGSTRLLESELKDNSDQIRTIIKARGISYPNVTGKTFAVFRVDSKHHLVSLVSMMDPSPDWIVGVSGLELCLPNCSWIEYKIHNLYPWDAGTDSGPTYISPDQPTHPQVPIKRIRTKDPNDPRSPFYDTSGAEMKPLARLYISRQRLYEKNCENSSNEVDPNACETLPWSEWSECNVKCGKGKRYRQREYKDSVLGFQMNCKKKLTQRETCYGTDSDCDGNDGGYNREESEENNPDSSEGGLTPECALTPWSDWTSCSAICGKGTKTKTRGYVNPRAKKRCEAGTSNKPPLEMNEECFGRDCTGDIQEPKEDHPDCRMSKWSSWSPCSVTCGNGTQSRRRHLIRYRPQGDPDADNNVDMEEVCADVKKEEQVICATHRSCDQLIVPEECFLKPVVGHCRSTFNRWYYDINVQDCAVFSYSGCDGNANQFESREECLARCRVEDNFDNLSVENLRIENIYDKVDCKVSKWIPGSCNATCGEGYQIKTRKVIRSPRHGGKLCPKHMIRIEKCFINCPNFDMRSGYSARNPKRYRQNEDNDDCQYSEWSPWSPCSATCGSYVARQRTRYVLTPSPTTRCLNRVQQEQCDVPQCYDYEN